MIFFLFKFSYPLTRTVHNSIIAHTRQDRLEINKMIHTSDRTPFAMKSFIAAKKKKKLVKPLAAIYKACK